MPVINIKAIDFSEGTIIQYNNKAVEWAKINNPDFSTIISGMLDYKFLIKRVNKTDDILEIDVSVYPEGNILYSWKLSKVGKGTECPFPIFIRSKIQ